MLIDTHCHVADPQFDADRDAVIARAAAGGVATLVEIAESPATWEAAVALAERFPQIQAVLGIHPHHAHEAGPEVWPGLEAKLRALLQHPKVVALGEFGLDYYRMRNTKEQQMYLLRRQLDLAQAVGKPIVIHCREDSASLAPGEGAHADLQDALADYFPPGPLAMECPEPNGVIHCFSGTWEDAQAYMLRGFYLGVDAPVTYPSAKRLQQIVMRMPVERLVLETDSPYLPPQQQRGQRNEPAYVAATAEAVAALKRRTNEEIAERTTLNARHLFRLRTHG